MFLAGDSNAICICFRCGMEAENFCLPSKFFGLPNCPTPSAPPSLLPWGKSRGKTRRRKRVGGKSIEMGREGKGSGNLHLSTHAAFAFNQVGIFLGAATFKQCSWWAVNYTHTHTHLHMYLWMDWGMGILSWASNTQYPSTETIDWRPSFIKISTLITNN